MVFKKKMLKRELESRKPEAEEKLHNVQPSPDISRAIRSSGLDGPDMQNAFRNLKMRTKFSSINLREVNQLGDVVLHEK
jgi:hypothetical protein